MEGPGECGPGYFLSFGRRFELLSQEAASHMKMRKDKGFISFFDEATGHYMRSGIIQNGVESTVSIPAKGPAGQPTSPLIW